ncbi:hypothetical protein IC582_008653 [Cucumis melo]
MFVDIQTLDADFLVASSHKMCGPTGIGFLYGKIDLLFAMPPFLDGGDFLTIPHLHNLVPDLKLGRLQLEKQLVWELLLIIYLGSKCKKFIVTK